MRRLQSAIALALLLAGTACFAGDATNAPPSASASLEFLDGSLLLGSLQSIDSQNGVRWKHAGAKSPLEFVTTNLHQIRFNALRTFNTNAVATCRLRFTNGDDVSGELVALDENSVEINTWFAGVLRAPRSALASIAVMGAGNSVIYEGPENADGWKFSGSPAMGGRVFAGGFGGPVIIDNGVIIQGGGVVRSSSTNVWQVRNNALIASGAGTAGRDFKLPPLSRIEFDLAWRQTPSMRIGICTDNVDRMDMSSGYQFYLSSSYMYLYRRSGGDGGAVFSASENVRIPQMALRSKVHFEFRLNKEKETISLLADGQPVKTWRVTGAQPEGAGLLFYSQRSDAALRIGNLRVSAWDGREEINAPTNAITETILHLANTDKVTGKVEGIRNGKLALATPAGRLDIPIQRAAHIFFPTGTNAPPAGARPADVRVATTRGDALLLSLDKWDSAEATGTSPNFGKVTLKPQAVKQLLFNPSVLRPPADDLAQWDDALFRE